MTKQQPIYVIKRKGSHGGGHHGGAWKVAYADFVTAMMSLFIVLWLMNTSVNVRKAVAGYYNDPSGKSTETGTDRAGSGESMPLTRDNIQHLKEQLEKSITQMNDLSKLSSQIQMTVTPEGLRIELLESKDGTFFDTGSAALNGNGDQILHLLAQQLGKVPNQISLEGHTDSRPFAADQSYGNWELSVDRANAARRVMQTAGVRGNQISQVRGYADQRLRMPQSPLDPSNRRISLIVQYIPGGPAPDSAKPGTPAKHAAEK